MPFAVKPDFSRESNLYARGEARVVGVDEAGRGPLAGPVVACAVWLDPSQEARDALGGLDDSKRLSQVKREQLLNVLHDLNMSGRARIGFGVAEPVEIERLNILWATMTAMERAVASVGGGYALVDGNRVPAGLVGEAIVKGDGRCLSIAAASVCAKQLRDSLMRRAESRFPDYGMEGHKGYPTRAHNARLASIGPCPIHRWGFGGIGTLL